MRRPVKSLNMKSLLICLILIVSVSLVEVICAYAFGDGFSLGAAAPAGAAGSGEDAQDVVARYKELGIPLDPYATAGSASGAGADSTSKPKDTVSYALNTVLELKNAKTLAKLGLENPSSNGYLIKVRIELVDDGLVVYESGFIGPGMQIKEAPLDAQLEKGEYAAKAYITAYQIDEEQTFYGDVNNQPDISIVVKN